MEVELAKIIKSFAEDIVEEARKIMASNVGINEKTGTNTLKNSDLYKQIDWSFREEGEDIIIDTLFNFYITFVRNNVNMKFYKVKNSYKNDIQYEKSLQYT